jgi:NADH-quinone oxidoreductase subunit M
MSGFGSILLLASLFLPLVAGVYLAARRARPDGLALASGSLSLAFAWLYAAVAATTAAVALATDGGLSVTASVMRIGVSGFEIEPRLFLDARGALFLLLLALCPPIVLTLLRGVRSVDAAGRDARSQDVAAWALVFGLAGVFLVDSLLLFYLFWELALIAVYFWIGLHGRRNRFGGPVYPALMRFVLFTLAGSLPMLASIAAVCATNFRDPGLSGLPATIAHLSDTARSWVFLGFLLGFAVKLPLFGFHGWLRDTYNVAPPACRALLSAAMSKMGAFGLLLVLAPAFSVELARYAPVLLTLAAIGALYGGVLMLAQDRLVDMLAYASLSHLSILALGVFSSAASLTTYASTTAGFSGAALLVLSHALVMAFLFALDARALPQHDGAASADRGLISGLRGTQPRLYAFMLLAVFASASLPGLNNFPGEVLVLFAAYNISPWLALAGGLGALIGAAALVRLLHNVWLGAPGEQDTHPAVSHGTPDLSRTETLLALAVSALWLIFGLYPMLLLGPLDRAFNLIQAAGLTP